MTSLEYGGSFTLGELLPLPLAANTALTASLNAQIGDLAPQLAGLTALSVRPPPSLLELIANLERAIEALKTLVANPLPDVQAVLTAIADIGLRLGSLQGQLSLPTGLASLFSAAGVHFYVFTGKAPELSPRLGALLTGGLPGSTPDANCGGVILLATDAGAIEAIAKIFRG
jgi:hypothetical protein